MTTLSRSVSTLKANVLRYRFEQHCPRIVASNISALELHRPESGATVPIVAEGRLRLVERHEVAAAGEAAAAVADCLERRAF